MAQPILARQCLVTANTSLGGLSVSHVEKGDVTPLSTVVPPENPIPAAFHDILMRKRCSSDVPGFIDLSCGMRRVLGLPRLV